MDRKKNMCFHITPIYFGDRPVTTRGKPNESKDYLFRCYVSANEKIECYRQATTIEELCNGCKKYLHIKPLTKEEIKEKYYGGKPREVMVVSTSGWYFKEI
jgi:hypothetical protein